MAGQGSLDIVILAGGVGVRTKQKTPKPLLEVCGRTMLEVVIEKATKISKNIYAVISPEVKKSGLKINAKECIQNIRDGSGGALKRAVPLLKGEDVMVLYTDVPGFKVETLKNFIDFHIKNNYDASLITMEVKNPSGYGRVIKSNGEFVRIVEESEVEGIEESINEVNTGICIIKRTLLKYLKKLKKHNGEYYLTDLFSILKVEGYRIGVYTVEGNEFMGVNNLNQLFEVARNINNEIIENLRLTGVIIEEDVKIDLDVRIKPGARILKGSILRGRSFIGSGCVIGPYSYIENSKIMDGASIIYSHVVGSKIGRNTVVGPYARLRNGSVISDSCKIGNFVELKKAVIKSGSKVPHLSYIGDAYIGRGVNVGAGAITCNYDGYKKHKTYIDDGSFIGSNVNLVAPVRVGKKSIIGAGSTITKNVKPYTLAIERASEIHKDGWVKKNR